MADNETPTNAQGGGEQPESGGKVFTQDELDRILSDRLARERQKFADYDDLKGAAEKLAELEAEQMSELEKAQKAREDAEAKAQAALEAANDRLMRAAFIAEAAKAGASHPEDAYALADKAGVEMGDDGSVSGVAEAVATLVEAGRLVMSGKPHAPNLDGGAGSGERPKDKELRLTEPELATAKRMGLTPAEYAEYKEEH